MKELKLIWRYVRRYGLMYLIGIIALTVVDGVNSLVPTRTSAIVDGLTDGTIDLAGVLHLVGQIALMGGIIALGRFCWRYFIMGPARMVDRDLKDDLFAHLERLSVRYYNEHKTGDLMAHFTNDLSAIRILLGPTVVTAFDATVMLLLVLYQMVFYVNLKLTLLAILPLVLIIYGDYIYGKLMHKRFLEKQEAFSLLTDQTQEAITGIRVIKAFVQERKELYAFAKTNRLSQEKNLGVVQLQALFVPLMDVVIGCSSLITLIYGGYLAIEGTITLGQFVAFHQYVNMLVWPMMAVGECMTYVSQGMASMKRIRVIFDEEPDIVNSETCDEVSALAGDIDLKNLTFAYPDQEDAKVLEQVTVHIQKGETLAILGRTGSGKSTLADLMLRLYDTGSDMIAIDGHPLSRIPLEVLRRDIAYVPQESFLFSDTVENNIAFGAEHRSHEDIIRAAQNACIHNNILDFPGGYDTLVGERGVTMSGGQKQRSAIARALLKDAPILILDDALSAVDTNTEEQILHNLRENRAGKTTLIIAHRISTIQNADHILVLDEGKMAEYGSHQELMALGGIYRSIYEKQQLEQQLEAEGGDAE
jgi:ATP-binding cassette subfamily B protein